jgi:hypothetical protein
VETTPHSAAQNGSEFTTIPAGRQPMQPRVTDQEIQKWISRQHGFVPESAWLLHCKEQFGLVPPGTAPQENPCPP